VTKPAKPAYLSVREAAAKLHIAESTLRRRCVDDEVEGAIRVAGVWLIPTSARLKPRAVGRPTKR
jgi:hypothetical protein